MSIEESESCLKEKGYVAEDFSYDVLDADSEIRYSKKVQLHHNFPFYDESGSEANRLAVSWAHLVNTEVGDQTLISYDNNWYIVEKFDDADFGYQVEDMISEKEFNEIFEEIKQNGRSGKIKSIQGNVDEYDKFYKSSNFLKERKSSFDSNKIEH